MAKTLPLSELKTRLPELVAGVCVRDRAGGKSPSPVRFELFETQRPAEILTICGSDLHPSSLTLHPSHLHSPLCWMSFATRPVQPV